MSYATAPIVSGPYPALPKIDFGLPSGYQQPHIVGGVRKGRYYPSGWNKTLIGREARKGVLSWRDEYNEGGYLSGLAGPAEDLETQAQILEQQGQFLAASSLRAQAAAVRQQLATAAGGAPAPAPTDTGDSAGSILKALASAAGDVVKGAGAAYSAYSAQKAALSNAGAGQPIPAPMPQYTPRTGGTSSSLTPLLALGALGLLAWAVLK